MECKSSKEVIDLYRSLESDLLNHEVLILIFYFACTFRSDHYSHVKSDLKELALKGLRIFDSLDITYRVSYLWSLGLLIQET